MRASDDPGPTARLSRRPSILSLGVAFALGCAAGLSGFVFGMPGNGLFVPATWLAGFIALLIAPSWPGFVALITGATLTAALLDLSDGVSGLLLLIVAVVSAVAAHGALCAFVLRRLRTLGLTMGLRDGRVRAGGGLAVGVVLVFVWIAADFARNPP